MTSHARDVSALAAPQQQAARATPGPDHAGASTVALDLWARLDRWLVLGGEGSAYHAAERAMTRDDARTVEECLGADGPRTVARLTELSVSGRAPKSGPLVFALALATGHPDLATRRAALAALPRVCRTGADLFRFARDVETFRRWGRGLRAAVAAWYNDKPAERLAHQVVQHRPRDGWSHRDLLRLSHPRAPTPEHDALYRWIVGGTEALGRGSEKGRPLAEAHLPATVRAFEALHAATDGRAVASIVRRHRFTHELVPSGWKSDPDVWVALLEDLPQAALLRSLGGLTAVGLLTPCSVAALEVAARITDGERLRRARVHPIAVLSALRAYEQGHGDRAQGRPSALSWTPVQAIVEALGAAFYLAFRSVEPTGKTHLLALDVSGSMTTGAMAGLPGLTPRVASSVMAMATARSEAQFLCVAFGAAAGSHGENPGLMPLTLSPRQRLDDVLRTVEGLPFGGTDCSQPILWALKNRIPVDTFVIYTDDETGAGDVHPSRALAEYRQRLGRAARLIVVGMTSTGFSLADPRDPGMLDVVGFDAAAPRVMADFARG